LPTPSQLSATSQVPAAARQTLLLLASAGHATLDPVQLSAGSHVPAEARHSVPAATKASTGHVPLDPVQVSWASQTAAAARQTVPAASNVQADEQQSPLAVPPSSQSSPF
jgi:hypothetical protein